MINLYKSMAIFIVLISVGIESTSIHAQSFDENAIISEVTSVWNAYISALAEGRADVIADNIYAAPTYLSRPQGTLLQGKRNEIELTFENNITNLAAQDYEKTETRYINVCVLNQSAVILSAALTRYRTDGSVLLQGGATYFFARFAEGWRIVATAGHAPDEIVRCAE